MFNCEIQISNLQKKNSVMNFVIEDVTLMDIESPKTTNRNQCRICLMEVIGETDDLCACRGHLKKVHEKCLLQWLKRTVTNQEMAQGAKKCQICKEPIRLKISKSYSCNSLSDIINDNIYKNHCDIDTKFALLITLFFLAFITMVIVLVNYACNREQRLETLYLIIAMAFVSFFALVFIIKCFIVKESYELKGVKQKKSLYIWPNCGKVYPQFF